MATLEEFFAQSLERITKLQEKSFATVQHTEAMVQHLEESTTSIYTTYAPIVNMHKCQLEECTLSEDYLEIFQKTHDERYSNG